MKGLDSVLILQAWLHFEEFKYRCLAVPPDLHQDAALLRSWNRRSDYYHVNILKARHSDMMNGGCDNCLVAFLLQSGSSVLSKFNILRSQ